jgi:cleavage and polyadenylation specificity factor subunit 1
MSHTHSYAELHAPTAVTASVAAFFTRSVAQCAAPELLVARGNVLHVYSVAHERDGGATLRSEATFTLHGVIESLAVLRRRSGAPRSQRDALLITSREAKLSVVEWDPPSRGLRTSSLHRWEGLRDGGAAGAAPTRCTEAAVAPKAPRVIADPEGRAAAVLLGGGGEVALLPAVRARDAQRRTRGCAASTHCRNPDACTHLPIPASRAGGQRPGRRG